MLAGQARSVCEFLDLISECFERFVDDDNRSFLCLPWSEVRWSLLWVGCPSLNSVRLHRNHHDISSSLTGFWRMTENIQVDIVDQIAMYIHSSIFTLLGFLGMLGFVGALARSRGAVVSFSIGIAIHLGLSIASGVFTIYSIFKENSAQAVEACMEGKTDDETRKICQTGMGVVKGVIVAVYVIAWLIELCEYSSVLPFHLIRNLTD